MKRHLFGFMSTGLAVVLIAGCKSDPQSSIAKTPASISTSASFVTVDVADSQRVDAQIMDAQGTPLVELPTVKSNAPAVVEADTFNSAPVPQTSFWVKGLTFGTGTITVSGGGLNTTVGVRAIPHGAEVGGLADTLGSGSTGQLYGIALDANNDSILVPQDSFSWSSDAPSVVSIDSTGAIVTKAPGTATITVTPPGGKSPGTAPVTVVPGTFAGTFSSTSGSPGDKVSATRASGGPVFDSDTKVFVDGVETFVDSVSASGDKIYFVVPPIGKTGAVELLFTGMGPDQVAQKSTFTSNTASYDDAYSPANEDPATAPSITADGNYYIILHGSDTDDFFHISGGASGVTVTVTASWFTPADVDILWCNAACTAYVGNFNGATSANPETSTVTVPAGTIYNLWFDQYAAGSAADFVQVNITGF